MRYIYLRTPDGNDIPAHADEEGRLKTTPGLRIVESFNQDDLTSDEYTFGEDMGGFGVANDGSDLTFTIDTIEVEVKAGESFHGYFEKFDTVTFSSGAEFRAYGLR